MAESMRITSSTYASALLTLPWDIPLEEWPPEIILALPRGISRHVVRFVELSGRAAAVKEIGRRTAYHEYKMLRQLQQQGAPAVVPIAVITGRGALNAELSQQKEDLLTAALVTEHLPYSLPYRELFQHDLDFRSDRDAHRARQLLRALALLMVRLHLLNFYWGDVSLSNTLFRRDAETFSAYLVDAETGEFQPQLSTRRREYDVEIARINVIGELMDLQAGGFISPQTDVVALGDEIELAYHHLWEELTARQTIRLDEPWQVSARIARLEEIGFDIGELTVTHRDPDGTEGAHNRWGSQVVDIQPITVDAGHHHRELLRLTGLDVGEQQARRLLSAIEAFRLNQHRTMPASQHPISSERAAISWLSEEYEPTIAAIPQWLLAKLEPAQIFHEILDHRWYRSENLGFEISMAQATAEYIAQVLPSHPDEARVLGLAPGDSPDTAAD